MEKQLVGDTFIGALDEIQVPCRELYAHWTKIT